MYKDDIKELYSQKKEALMLFIRYSIPVLLKLYMFMPNNFKERKIFAETIKSYIKYHNDEKEILAIIKKKYGNIDYIEYIDIILDELEDMLVTKQVYRGVVSKDKVLALSIDIKRKYINQLGGK